MSPTVSGSKRGFSATYDDPEHVHVHHGKDKQVGPHYEDGVPGGGVVIGVVGCDDSRRNVGADIGDRGKERYPREPGNPALKLFGRRDV